MFYEHIFASLPLLPPLLLPRLACCLPCTCSRELTATICVAERPPCRLAHAISLIDLGTAGQASLKPFRGKRHAVPPLPAPAGLRRMLTRPPRSPLTLSTITHFDCIMLQSLTPPSSRRTKRDRTALLCVLCQALGAALEFSPALEAHAGRAAVYSTYKVLAAVRQTSLRVVFGLLRQVGARACPGCWPTSS